MDYIKKQRIKTYYANKIDSDSTAEFVTSVDSEIIRDSLENLFKDILNDYFSYPSLKVDVTFLSPMMYMITNSSEPEEQLYSSFLLDDTMYVSRASYKDASPEFSVIIEGFVNKRQMEEVINFFVDKAGLISTNILYTEKPLCLRFDFYYGSFDTDRLFHNLSKFNSDYINSKLTHSLNKLIKATKS